MTAGQQKRIRARLARRGNAPRRLRQRPRRNEQGGRIPWITIGTVLGAVAAIGSVIFTGVATYYSARVSALQLEQAHEDAAKESKEQAATFAYWLDPGGSDWSLHVQNRSPDPITLAVVSLTAQSGRFRTESSLPPNITVYAQLATTRLGPCTELVYSAKQLPATAFRISMPKGPDPFKGATQLTLEDVRVSPDGSFADFTDRNGERWRRTQTSLRHWEEARPTFNRPAGSWHAAIKDDPIVRRAAVCDERP